MARAFIVCCRRHTHTHTARHSTVQNTNAENIQPKASKMLFQSNNINAHGHIYYYYDAVARPPTCFTATAHGEHRWRDAMCNILIYNKIQHFSLTQCSTLTSVFRFSRLLLPRTQIKDGAADVKGSQHSVALVWLFVWRRHRHISFLPIKFHWMQKWVCVTIDIDSKRFRCWLFQTNEQ